MEIIKTAFKDLVICEPKIHGDGRGYFFESYNEKQFHKKTGLKPNFVQDNQSKSRFGVLRGLHFQVGENAQAKLVRVIHGEVLDVVVDLRKSSLTFGKSFSLILNAQNQKQLFIPRGFAHGFLTLSSTAIFSYKCDNYYNKESERGLNYNDPELDINWYLEAQDFILSDRDKEHPNLKELIKIL